MENCKVILQERATGRIEEIQKEIEQLGFVVEETFPEIGVMFGKCDLNNLGHIACVDGVYSASQEHETRILQ